MQIRSKPVFPKLFVPALALVGLLSLAACDTKEKSSTSTAIDPNAQTTTNGATNFGANGDNASDDAMNGAAEMHNSMARTGTDGRKMDGDGNGPMQGGGMAGGMGPGNTPASGQSNQAASPAPAPVADPPMKDDM